MNWEKEREREWGHIDRSNFGLGAEIGESGDDIGECGSASRRGTPAFVHDVGELLGNGIWDRQPQFALLKGGEQLIVFRVLEGKRALSVDFPGGDGE